jgi:hypothetical protein
MVRGQVSVALAGAGEVGVQAPTGGADVGGGAVHQPGGAEPGQRGEPVARRTAGIDVEHVRSRSAGGDGQVPIDVLAEPGGDLLLVGGGVQVAVAGGGDLLAGPAGEHRPAAGRAFQGMAQRGVVHRLLFG